MKASEEKTGGGVIASRVRKLGFDRSFFIIFGAKNRSLFAV